MDTILKTRIYYLNDKDMKERADNNANSDITRSA